MGLAASQARYLTLTSRKSDLEYQSQTINSRRIQLSYRTAEIARAYSEGMNNKVIKMMVSQLDTDGTSTKTWKELTFQNLLATGEYMLIGTAGTPLVPSPYISDNVSVNQYHRAKSDKDCAISAEDWENLDPELQAAYHTCTLPVTTDTTETAGADTEKTGATDKTDGQKTIMYTLNAYISEDIYKKLVQKDSNIAGLFESDMTTHTELNWKINPKYATGANAMDLQSLLVSGKAQIVSRDFFNYMVNIGGYSYDNGLAGSNRTYKSLLDDWESDESYNAGHKPSEIDWRADESSTFAQKTYTEDDADVLAAYESATAEVQAQDKMLEMEEKNIETQHKAIETELENIKKVIQKNIDDTFKIFS